jgi:hypothetical protein
VPYRGTAQVLPDLPSGEVQTTCEKQVRNVKLHPAQWLDQSGSPGLIVRSKATFAAGLAVGDFQCSHLVRIAQERNTHG